MGCCHEEGKISTVKMALKKSDYRLVIWQGQLYVVYMAILQNSQMEPHFGWRVTLLPKSYAKHIRIILTSMLTGGQVKCRLERIDRVC